MKQRHMRQMSTFSIAIKREAFRPVYMDFGIQNILAENNCSIDDKGRAQYNCLNANKLFDISYWNKKLAFRVKGTQN